MLTLFGYVFKNLGRQKLRTALTALGVMLGIWLVVIFAAISAGILKAEESLLTVFGEDFQVYKAKVADRFLSGLPESETRETLRSFPGIRDTASVKWWFARIQQVDFALLLGLRPEEFALARLLEEGDGGFSGPDVFEVIAGRAILDRLGAKIGESIEIEGSEYRVVGSFSTGQPLQDNALVVPFDRMQAGFYGGGDLVTYMAVRVEEGSSSAEVSSRLEEAHPDFAAVGELEHLQKVDQGIETMKDFGLVVSVVATGLGLLFLTLAMVMSVFERTREFGILRAVGWAKWQIVTVVFVEAALISILGALVGIPTGQGIVELISRLTELSAYLRPAYELGLYVRVFSVALFAAAVGGIYPAWRASRLRPVQALRHE